MTDVVQQRSRATALLLAVAAALVCTFVCGLASGSPLSVVPAALLVRYVWADYEGTMTLALMSMGVLTLVALVDSPAACLIAAGGAFVAAEIASLGAHVRRIGSDSHLHRRLLDLGGNIVFGLAAMGFGVLVTVAEVPVWAALAALAVVGAAGVAWWATASAPSAELDDADHPRGAPRGDSGRTGR